MDSDRKEFETTIKDIKEAEDKIKALKLKYAECSRLLETKIEMKRYGNDELKAYYTQQMDFVQDELDKLLAQRPPVTTKDKTALNKQKNQYNSKLTLLRGKYANADSILTAIGGMMTEDECRELILEKHHRLIGTELERYLNAEKGAIIGLIDNLWDKYAVSHKAILSNRDVTLSILNQFLTELNYV